MKIDLKWVVGTKREWVVCLRYYCWGIWLGEWKRKRRTDSKKGLYVREREGGVVLISKVYMYKG